MSINDRYASELAFGLSLSTIQKLAFTDTKTRLLQMFSGPQSTHKLYCDMDGVLTDFTGRYNELSGPVPPRPYPLDPKVVSDPKFWSDMGWNPGGEALWSFIRDLDPTILTANPFYTGDPATQESVKGPTKDGKIEWCQHRLGLGPDSVVVEIDKQKEIARSGRGKTCVLIDDLMANLSSWEAAGGVGVLFTPSNPSAAIDSLNMMVEKEGREDT